MSTFPQKLEYAILNRYRQPRPIIEKANFTVALVALENRVNIAKVNAMKSFCVYRIVNFRTAECYIGQAIDPKRRYYRHFSELKHHTHCNQHLQRAYNKYGREAFYFEVLEKNIPQDQIDEREQYWIAHFDSYHNGYNHTSGGQSNNNAKGKTIYWNNVEYPSVREAAKTLGLHESTLIRYLRRGYAADSDLPKRTKSCIWNGVYYNSILEASRATGIARSEMGRFIRQGYSGDDDVNRGRICSWNGIQYSSLAAAARANGIGLATMKQRVDKGYFCDEDVHLDQIGKRVIWNGIEYPTMTACAESNGIEITTLTYRLDRGYTCDEDVHSNYRCCTWNGITYPSLKAAADANGLTKGTLWRRLLKGYTCDEDMKGKGNYFHRPRKS